MMWCERLGWSSLLAGLLMLMLVLCVPFSPCAAEEAVNWNKYVTADGSLSFYYPVGWIVQEDESSFVIHDERSYEQLWLVILPYQDLWTARDHAEFFLGLIQEENPEMQGYGFESQGDGAVLFGLVHGSDQNRAEGVGLVLKDSEFKQALWFHYLAPGDMFVESRSFAILEGFVSSLGPGSSAVSPASNGDARTERINQNADGFLFILEFALGAPLSLAEETLILNELRAALVEYSDAELAGYDDYPGFAQFIMSLANQDELIEVKRALHESVWEWVGESDPDDPLVSLIREALLEADEILVRGTTPLTEVAATAYAEFVAFAEHLVSNGLASADPSSIRADTVREIKRQLVDAWLGFSQEEKEQVLNLPAVWTTLRRALSHGEPEDRDYALNIIAKAAPREISASTDESYEGKYDPMALARHQTMLQINQMTFNHWQYSRGYTSTIWGW